MVRSLSAPSKSSLVMNGRGYRVIPLSRNPVCLSRRFYERSGSEREPVPVLAFLQGFLGLLPGRDVHHQHDHVAPFFDLDQDRGSQSGDHVSVSSLIPEFLIQKLTVAQKKVLKFFPLHTGHNPQSQLNG